MEQHFHYNTVSEAIDILKSKGYEADFNLEENCIVCHAGKFSPDSFEITEVFRYEGETDPADEATVYGIESSTGLKGILVTGYGAFTDTMTDQMLRKLRFHN